MCAFIYILKHRKNIYPAKVLCALGTRPQSLPSNMSQVGRPSTISQRLHDYSSSRSSSLASKNVFSLAPSQTCHLRFTYTQHVSPRSPSPAPLPGRPFVVGVYSRYMVARTSRMPQGESAIRPRLCVFPTLRPSYLQAAAPRCCGACGAKRMRLRLAPQRVRSRRA